jgi:hypothetical protein
VLVHGAWADASSWNSVLPAGARITDVDAGHLSLISEASLVTRVIFEAVQATG